MKKIPKIIPCICTTHTPCSVVNSEYGMPIMIPTGNGEQTWFGIKCPMCGRGGFNIMQYSSVYKAICAWNEMQKMLYSLHKRTIEYDRDYDSDDETNDYEHNLWANDLDSGYTTGNFTKSCNP